MKPVYQLNVGELCYRIGQFYFVLLLYLQGKIIMFSYTICNIIIICYEL